MKKGVVFRLFLLLFVIAPLGILVNAQNNSAGGASDNSEEVAMLTGLYRACLSSELDNKTSLYAKFLTKAMQEKVWRMVIIVVFQQNSKRFLQILKLRNYTK